MHQVPVHINPIVSFYNRLANLYDIEQMFFFPVRLPEKLRVTRSILPLLTPEMRILEIGCGTGMFTLEIAPKVAHVDAIDISPRMLELLRRKALKGGIENITPICADIMEAKLQGPYDVVVSCSAIEYIDDEAALFSKISTLCKPGGHIVISTAHDTTKRMIIRWGNFVRQKIFMKAYTKTQMKKLAIDSGLKVVEMRDYVGRTWFSRGLSLFMHAVKE